MPALKRLGLFSLLLPACLAFAGRPVPMVNPSFEDARARPEGPTAPDWEAKGPAPGWSVWIGSIARTGKPRIGWPHTEGHTGARCVQLAGCKGPVCVIQSAPVHSDRSYEARVWVKTNSAQPRCALSIRFRTADDKWAAGTYRVFLSATAPKGEWSELRLVFRPGKDAARAVFLLTADGQRPEDACWFDDVSLIEFEAGELVVSSCGWIHDNCLPVGKPAVTPHVPWAKPWAGKRHKVLFLIGSDHNLREPAEVAQRMDIEYDYAFAHSFEPTVYALNDREITDRLRSGYYDVVVVGVNSPAAMLAKLSEQARGLVLIRGPGIRPKLPAGVKLAPLNADLGLIEPLDALPEIDGKPAGAVTNVQAGVLGDARMVQITYALKSTCLTPNVSFDEHIQLAGGYWEAYFQLLARSILHGAGSRAAVRAELKPAEGAALLTLSATSATKVAVRVRHCDKIGRWYDTRFDASLGAGAQERRIELPAGHPPGPSTVLAEVRGADGRALGFAATRVVAVRPTHITKVEPDRPHYEASQAVRVRVAAAGDLAGVRVAASLTDAYGRVHAQAAASAGAGEAVVELSHEGKRSTFNWLTVRLLRGGTELDVQRTYVYAPLSREEFLGDYQVGTWACSSYMPAYLHPTLHRLMREAGITLGIQHKSTYASMLAGRMRLISTAFGRIPGYTRHESESHVRKQCLNDPAIQQRTADAAREVAKEELGPRPVFGYIRDETSLVRDHLAVDVCACEHCAAAFRQWLQSRYTTVERINAHWHTQYQSWDDIGFTTYGQVRGKDTFAPWVMFRRFQEWSWAEGIKRVNKHAREGDPTALLALPNTFGQRPFVGRDYWLLAQANAYTMEYPAETRSQLPNRAIFDTLRCFNPATRHHPWVGYVFEDPVIRFAPWWTAYHGATGAAVYGAMSFFAGKNSWAQIYPALQHTKRGLMYAEEFSGLKQGTGKLLMQARRPTPHVAILWSQAAMHVGWAMSDQTTNPTGVGKVNAYSQHFYSREACRQALLESWRQFDYVCEEQVRQGALSRYKWLLMPGAYAVDDDVAAAVEQFVADGGTVVADMGIGLTNEVGALLPGETRLTRLFGFQRLAGELDYTDREAKDLAPAKTVGAALQPFTIRGRERIEAAEGTVVSQYDDDAALLIARRHGKGRTLFINGVMPDSPALVPLFDSLPRLATVAYAGRADRPAGYELVRFETGANAYLGILRDWRAGGPDEPITVGLPRSAHVYNVRSRKYIGHNDRFQCNLPLGGAGLFALLPYRVEGLQLDVRSPAHVGGPLHLSCTVRAQGTVGEHIVRVELRRPDGKLAEAYGVNLVARAGKAEADVPLAFSDPPGRWTLVARDVATGVTVEKPFEVEGR